MHSFKEMETICEEMAADARPEDAEAIREIANNYRIAAQFEQWNGELSTRAVLLISAILFAIWTPIFWYFHLTHVPDPIPTGRIVEQITFRPTNEGPTAQTFRFSKLTSKVEDDNVAVLVELWEGKLQVIDRSLWSFNTREPKNYYRYITLKPDVPYRGRSHWITAP